MARISIVYVAGPYRSKRGPDGVRTNVERAKWWAEAVWRLPNVAAICPHTNTYGLDDAATEEEFIERDLEILRRCDAVLMLPGWERSIGAGVELNAARECDKPVYFWDRFSELVEAAKNGTIRTR